MTAPRLHNVLWTQTALEMLGSIRDRRIRQQIFDTSKRLESDPQKQGKPLREDLLGFRSLRVVGQRFRAVYSVDLDSGAVHVVAAGIRRQADRDDIYVLAQRLVRLGLAPSSRQRKASPGKAPHRKKKSKGGRRGTRT